MEDRSVDRWDLLSHAQALPRLRGLLGDPLVTSLEDPSVSDLLVNPDGSVWLDRWHEGRQVSGLQLALSDVSGIVQGVALLCGARMQSGTPILSAALGAWGAHFMGVVPPLVRAPSFSVHKFSTRMRSLDDLVDDGFLCSAHAVALRDAVLGRQNIVIGGGGRTGKTTLANALLLTMAEQAHRVLVLERAPQMRCAVAHHIPLRAWSLSVTMDTLIKTAMRWQPDRLVVGDLEGPEVPALLRHWEMDCLGGLATTAAGSARSALVRLEEMLRQAQHPNPQEQVASSVHVVVHLQGTGRSRRVADMASVLGAEGRGYRLVPLVGDGSA